MLMAYFTICLYGTTECCYRMRLCRATKLCHIYRHDTQSYNKTAILVVCCILFIARTICAGRHRRRMAESRRNGLHFI